MKKLNVTFEFEEKDNEINKDIKIDGITEVIKYINKYKKYTKDNFVYKK